MFASAITRVRETPYELRFNKRIDNECVYKFVCDVKGHVDMNALTDRALNNYLFARAVSGNQLLAPVVTKVYPSGRHLGLMCMLGLHWCGRLFRHTFFWPLRAS
jgi:hypothetical protein